MYEHLCLVAPCYNENDCVVSFVGACESASLQSESLSIVFVDDGSTDSTLSTIRQLKLSHQNIHCVSFSRNFGKEAALLAGMEKALQIGATHVVVMDVDLQDPPSLIPQMLDRMEQTGCDVVATYRETRTGEPAIRSWFAHRFYKLMSRFSDVELRDGARDFRLMTAEVVRQIVSLPENQRFSKGLFSWVGFNVEWIGYENVGRSAGETHWSFSSLVMYAIDGIVAFSVAPLVTISVLGLAIFFLSLFVLLFVFIRALLFGDPVAGWPSLVCIIALFAGILLLSVGVIGIYLSKVYLEIKRRPAYIIKEEF